MAFSRVGDVFLDLLYILIYLLLNPFILLAIVNVVIVITIVEYILFGIHVTCITKSGVACKYYRNFF